MANKNQRPLALAAVVLLAAFVIAWLWHERHRAPEPVSGTIEVDEVHIASRYGGRVEKIFAQEGDTLHAGDPVVELDASELRAHRGLMAAQLAEQESGPRAEEIAAAQRDWESLKAQLQFARADAQRQQDLLRTKTISANEAEKAASTANALEQSVAAAQQRYEQLRIGTRPERIDQARAQLAETDAQLREMRIIAPGECVLEVLSVKIGDVLAANREIATLILPQHLWVRVYVPEPWLGLIKVGESVRVRVDLWRDRDFPGTVEQINRSAEFTPRNVQTVEDRVKQVFGVKIRLDNREDQLRAGMSADVVFPNIPAALR